MRYIFSKKTRVKVLHRAIQWYIAQNALGETMPIDTIHSYLVYPNKGSKEPKLIRGAILPFEGKLYDQLRDVYEITNTECKIDISFEAAPDGKQENACRNLIIQFMRDNSIDNGRLLAERLSAFTTKRSSLGLMFLMTGNNLPHSDEQKLVVSRFPANQGILAEEKPEELNLKFIEQVFMRSAKAYKAALYIDNSLDVGFWNGRVVDKQINSRDLETSAYWIKDFLASDFLTTSANGTRRLAVAIRDAARTTNNLEIRRELSAAAILVHGLDGQILNVPDFVRRYGLSNEAEKEINKNFRNPKLAQEKFMFNTLVFKNELPYKSIELNTGVVLTAETQKFDKLITSEVINKQTGEAYFQTKGTPISEKFEKSK